MLGIIRFTPSTDGYALGSLLATIFGLNEHYFTEAIKKGTRFSKGIDIKNFNGHWYVKIPTKYYELMDNGYTAYRINDTSNDIEFVDLLPLTRNTIIGFCE